MKVSNPSWRERLAPAIAPHLATEVDRFENEVILKKNKKIDDKIFAETRLRRGSYGQRYDSGQRHDGKTARTLEYPSDNTKGPNTLWDAPGMQRIKIPYGGLNATQLEVLAELSEEYSDGIAHITTRQDVQLHFVHIEDTPTVMRRLAAVGITTREACGNTVRNVTGCPIAGVCRTEAFDVTPYANALAYFLMGHPDCLDFGRKFKVSLSGCRDEACALAHLNDIGVLAVVQDVNGKPKRGFELLVGGGLGTVPQQAKLLTSFVPEEELLPTTQAIARVFARLGEKKNRNTARLKFVIQKIGIEEFQRLVAEERAILSHDDRWTSYLSGIESRTEQPARPASLLQISGPRDTAFERWRAANVYSQRQPGFATVTIALPLGDLTAKQLRAVADISRTYIKETVRTTLEQNIVLRWVSESDLPALHAALAAVGLDSPTAGTIVDVVACPGTDTCKLGISSSRGLAGELRSRLAAKQWELDEAISGLHIKVSGCFNSCGQHHVADIGFYGVSRNKNGFTVPHFQVVLGGQWERNAGAYGLAIGAVPSKRVPETVERIAERFLAERTPGESFHSYIVRIGKAKAKLMIEDLMAVPPHEADPSFYIDWADAREYTTGDIGVGECAGEVISRFDFQITACEREVFEAQLALEANNIQQAATLAYEAMMHAATALLTWRVLPLGDGPEGIAANFKKHFHDTEFFFDPFSGGKFGQYYFDAHERHMAWKAGAPAPDDDTTRRLIEESQLVIEAAHSCHVRLSTQKAA
ncbi:MAG: nitrite/sulfite reductase [Bryobacterales bacterium]|nr:nitrite/sulfite reductase [Bryobacterales bacterium]